MNVEAFEHAVDQALASSFADVRAADKGTPMADFECPHGRLVSDITASCGCFGEDC